MALTQNYSGSLVVITCECGVTYGLDNSYRNQLMSNGATFYCPRGCARHYAQGLTKDQQIENLKREVESKKQQFYQEQERARLARADEIHQRGLKEKAHKKLRRIRKGICTDCRRPFINVKRHMESKHPKK